MQIYQKLNFIVVLFVLLYLYYKFKFKDLYSSVCKYSTLDEYNKDII